MVKKIRFYLILFITLFGRSRKKIFYSSIVILISLFLLKVILPFIIPQILAAYKEMQKPSFVEGVVGKPTYPNPIFDTTETQKDISNLVFRGLTKVNNKGELIPDLAESYKAVSDTEYVFKLKKDIYWSDGIKFTSDDVIFTVKTAQDPQWDSPLSASFKDIVIERLNDYEVKFKLKEPFAPFPYATTAGIIPKHIALGKYKPVGTGPFTVKNINKDRIVLTNDDLNIVFNFYPSLDQVKLALKVGEINSIGGLSPQEKEEMSKFGNINFYQKALPFREAIVFFNTKSEYLSERRVRQALSFAINKEDLKNIAAGKTAITAKNNLPLFSWVNNSKERYPFSYEESAKQLKLAGFVQKDGFWLKKEKTLSLKIVSVDDPELNSISNYLKESWSKLGIKVETSTTSPDRLKNDILANRNFEVLVNFQDLSPDPDQYGLWHTTQILKSNITGISSPKLDKILEDTRKLADQKERAAKYSLFTILLSDEAPAIFLYYPTYNWAVSRKIIGINLDNFAFTHDRFNSYQNWKIDKKLFH